MSLYGSKSQQRIDECAEPLQIVATIVAVHWDIIVICGHRSAEDQNAAYAAKRTKLRYPFSLHNKRPSRAIDMIPYHHDKPHIHWQDINTMKRFGSFVEGVAAAMNIDLRWGGDWDGDKEVDDQEFNDYVHFELVG